MYFESHAHYDDSRFDTDRDTLLASLPASGVSYVINAGADIEGYDKGIELAEAYDFIYAAVGVHPHNAADMSDGHLAVMEQCCGHPRVVAIGEIGLDYYYDNSPRELQRYWFESQLEMSKRVCLPVIIHCRDATADTYEIINRSGVRDGVIHCFSGSPDMAAVYVEMGFYIGLGGVVTFSKAKKAVEVAESIPLERLLIETDCPYLAPEPNRGQRNDSRNLKYIVKRIAEIKGISAEEAASATLCNGLSLFRKIARYE